MRRKPSTRMVRRRPTAQPSPPSNRLSWRPPSFTGSVGRRGTVPRPPVPHLGIGIAGRQPGRFLDIALRRKDLERMTPDGPERPHESEVEQGRGLATVQSGDRVQHAIDQRSSHGSLSTNEPDRVGGRSPPAPGRGGGRPPIMQWGMHSELRGSPARQPAKPSRGTTVLGGRGPLWRARLHRRRP